MAMVPKFYEMFNPLLDSFRNLQGSARNDELVREVIRTMGLGDEATSVPHGSGGLSEVAYRYTVMRRPLKNRNYFCVCLIETEVNSADFLRCSVLCNKGMLYWCADL